MAHQEYQYQELNESDSSIRLLTILPGPQGSPIELRLREARLDEQKGQYDAISYVWGPANNTHDVYVDGRTLQVRDNIYQFLVHFRDMLPYGSPITFAPRSPSVAQHAEKWIDSICIDQSNVRERNKQVRRMGAVYSNARCVLIWLDAVSERTSLNAVQCGMWKGWREAQLEARRSSAGEDMAMTRSQVPGVDGAATDRGQRVKNEEYMTRLCANLGINDHTGPIIEDSILQILQHPYWNRLWIVQEICLAPKAYIISGSELLPARELVQLWSTVAQSDNPSNGAQLLANKSNGFQIVHFWLRDLTLINQIIFTGSRQCSDPRDHVHAVLGMVQGGFVFQVDYGSELEDAVCDAIIFGQTHDEFTPRHAPYDSLDQLLQLIDILDVTIERTLPCLRRRLDYEGY
ncbi:hypothetical protein LTR10_005009 [Elasticomyces elasticus]|nr:hypothetical protein LTR10_005009 [Elasticomyces elasticus]KAK4975751.1 hypothetical protein LTR42_003371 [Elasticomyces elasticus]